MKAILDACVLYPASVRDVLIQFSVDDFFQAKWSTQIEREWTRNLLKDNLNIKVADLKRTQALMRKAIPDWRAKPNIKTTRALKNTDVKDRHVLSAAINSECSHIITFNIKDFDQSEARMSSVSIIDPDQFLHLLIKQNPKLALASFAKIRLRLRAPPIDPTKFTKRLRNISLIQVAQFLNNHLDSF